MKKLLIILGALVTFVSPAMAATIVSDYQTSLDKNEAKAIAPVKLTSTAEADITAEYGIRILLDADRKILFDSRPLTFIGSAIDNGRVNLNVQASFSADYKSLFIPVMQNFQAGDWLQISGLALRAYNDDFNARYLGLDLNGDFTADVTDINTYSVDDDERTDVTAPYPVTNVEHVINSDGSVTFTWDTPPDYDYNRTVIDRNRIKGGFSSLTTVYDNVLKTFTDSDLKDVTSASYNIVAKDVKGNGSEPVVIEIDFSVPAEEPVEEEPVMEEPAETPEEEAEVPETEVQEMSRLLNYYNVRHSIKCMPSGVAVAENNSACLWARIDLIYAQEISGQEKVAGLALSARDLELMQTRRRWPEMRYEDNCVAASEPAGYCSALGKALDRISYFLD